MRWAGRLPGVLRYDLPDVCQDCGAASDAEKLGVFKTPVAEATGFDALVSVSISAF